MFFTRKSVRTSISDRSISTVVYQLLIYFKCVKLVYVANGNSLNKMAADNQPLPSSRWTMQFSFVELMADQIILPTT